MANLPNEQIEQKKQQLQQLTEQAKALYDELVEAGVIELSDDDLDQAAGGSFRPKHLVPLIRDPDDIPLT